MCCKFVYIYVIFLIIWLICELVLDVMVFIWYYFLILNVILVLGMNVLGDIFNKMFDVYVCMVEILLFRFCIKICGDIWCDMYSFCGEDKCCLYCFDVFCKLLFIGCEILCVWRFIGNVGFF